MATGQQSDNWYGIHIQEMEALVETRGVRDAGWYGGTTTPFTQALGLSQLLETLDTRIENLLAGIHGVVAKPFGTARAFYEAAGTPRGVFDAIIAQPVMSVEVV